MEAFLNIIIKVVEVTNTILWKYILLVVLVGLGIFLTFRLNFPQFSRVFPAFKKLIHDIKHKVPAEEGQMTPFQSLSTAVAAQVGTGNIVGVATAIASGGPGAAFWMLLSAFFGMSTIFCEAVLAQIYREKVDGDLVGGPAYYIKNGLQRPWLAKLFAAFCVIALGFVGIMVQSNSVVTSLNSAFGLSEVWVTIGLIAIVGIILTGGMDRIASFSANVVPFMAFAYIFGSIIIVLINISNLIPACQLIIQGAFRPQSIGGGVLGIGIQHAIRFGLSRGLFSNEAGMGSTPHSHAVAGTKHPAEQGFIAMIGVFISTFFICLSTVMVNLSAGSYQANIRATEMAVQASLMTQNGFEAGFGTFGAMFLSISLTCFSLTTIVGWYFFAESNIKLLIKQKLLVGSFKFIVLGFCFLGAFIKPGLVWELADMFMGLMALPNIIAIFLLSKEVADVLKDYDQCIASGELTWHYDYE